MVGLDYIKAPYPAPERVYYVSSNFTNNKTAHQYNTIQSAIDVAYDDHGVISDVGNGVVILVYPGWYDEQIHSYSGYHIQGFSHGSASETKPTTLYNTGADPDHYPLRGDDGDRYYIEGITIEVDAGGVVGKLTDMWFLNVKFIEGEFIEPTETENTYSYFKGCGFHKTRFNCTGTTANGRRTLAI